ncbi:MAG TPA: M14 family metallopeptidase [Candidatus Acidoferrales bacterium]|nr:M14 family metallopeptidase [Candidatus Acidoferrales bacterium]
MGLLRDVRIAWIAVLSGTVVAALSATVVVRAARQDQVQRASSVQSASSSHLENAFAAGWMLIDTNENGIADAIDGHVVVPAQPTAAENTAAANLAARLGYGTSGLTLPIVATTGKTDGKGPRIWIGKNAMPQETSSTLAPLISMLEKGEGGVFLTGDNLAIVGFDDTGLLAAADAYSARAPYQWKVPGEELDEIAKAVGAAAHGGATQLIGVTYAQNIPGIRRAFLHADGTISTDDLRGAFSSPHLAAVRQLIVIGGPTVVSVENPKPMAAQASATDTETKSTTTRAAGAGAEASSAAAQEGTEENPSEPSRRLDLATLYTGKGLFNAAPKIPVPATLNAHLYVPAGAEGVAMANLAARMGLETTGITLPIASPATDAKAKDVKTQAVIAGASALTDAALKKLSDEDTVASQAETSLASGEGEARVVDDAFPKHGAVIIKGDDEGSVAALDLISGRFPNLWEPGKQYLSIENIRYGLHRFFSLHSSAGQASAALYHLDRWMKQINEASSGTAGIHDVKANVYVDLADPGLADYVRKTIEQQLHVSDADVQTGSLHAGTQCCDANPALHYEGPETVFHQAKPTFSEDLVIPWEGNRLLHAVEGAARKIQPSQPVTVVARVSEGPEERQKLTAAIEAILALAGVARGHMHVEVLCAFKQGYSWLMDEIAPELANKSVAKVQIDFAKDADASHVRTMYSQARWVQELYPVDEMVARKLNLPLAKITFDEFISKPGDPTYRVHAFDAAGHEMLSRDFRVATVMQPYNGVMPRYEEVQVETGWVHIQSAAHVLLDERIPTDIEEFWDHYQNVTLPRIYQFIMAQAHGDVRAEYQPLFDTLRMDFHMSEPDYNLGLDHERISSLEALQEDTFYATDNFFDMMGDLETGHPFDYAGRIIPIVHPSEDGKDGRVHIEFYGKPAANPLVRLSWTDAQGARHEKERHLPALSGAFGPRLIQARVKAGEQGVESLTWSLPADYLHDEYQDWVKLAPREQVEHTIFSVEQAEAQLHWLEEMHAAGIYRDALAYAHLQKMAMEFELPRPLTAKVDSPEPRAYVSWEIPGPADPRPMIMQASKSPETSGGESANAAGGEIVQWDEPISPAGNARILARLAAYPGVNVYWMGRSYLGQNIWAADIMQPSPSRLRSWAKETTLKASIIYSGRQHANEVSSTSHVDKLGELLVSDPQTRVLLKQVNVVLHPIDNPDGAQLSVELAKITPDNLLHPGYHGSLGADVTQGQAERDPIYPESRTRPLLLQTWLPDAFLNPHGYPSHEWIQPFSEYSAWVQTRESANPGRAWWIPRGWFTSMGYLRDPAHPESEQIAYALRDRIVAAERSVPGLLPLENRMNARYERYGQRWDPDYMTQPIVDGIRIYMALKGSPAPARSGAGELYGGASPNITWDTGYTEAPDETAHGDYMRLLASAGLAFDEVHLKYLAQGKLRITHTEKEVSGGISWQVMRERPILPSVAPPTKDSPAPNLHR